MNSEHLPLTGSLSWYRSERNSRWTDKPDGKGSVWLATIGRPFSFVPEKPDSPKRKPLRVLSALVGAGSGDKKATSIDEGYIGERGNFARDIIFLSLVSSIDAGSPGTSDFIPGGLSNKQYLGLQYTDNSTSLLEWFATGLLRVDPLDVVSKSTTISLHDYRFREPVRGSKEAGRELDIEFRMEQPKDVKWRMAIGYLLPGDAIRDFVKEEPWSITLARISHQKRAEGRTFWYKWLSERHLGSREEAALNARLYFAAV